jgi:imidazolonepropionase-like amidohydrolase
MKRALARVSLVVAVAWLVAAPSAWSRPNGTTTAFVGVNVVPGDREAIIPDQTVIVQDGRIARIGPAARVKSPAGATVVSGQGKFLMPGLAEMHGHLPGPAIPEVQWQNTMKLFVAAGVTTVRGMQGAPNQFAIRDRIARGEVLGPRLFLYGPAMSAAIAPTPAQAAARVEEYRKAGYDGLKIMEGLSLESYQAIARAAQRVGMPFGGHVPNAVGLERALAAGQRSIEHLDGYVEALVPGEDGRAAGEGSFAGMHLSKEQIARIDERRIPSLVAATRRAGAMVVPTLAVWRTLFGDASAESLRKLPEMKYAVDLEDSLQRKASLDRQPPPLEDRRRLMAVRDRVLAALARAGGLVMLGADAPQLFSVPGFSLRNEVEALVKAGMTPAQVVEAGTIAPARYLGREREFGSVAVGKRADLILVDGNPLEDVANVFRSSGVMLNGRWLARAELDEMLGEIERFTRSARFPEPSAVKDLPVPARESAPLTGSYKMSNGVTVAIGVEQDGLVLTASAPDPGGPKRHRLLSQGNGRYLIPAIRAVVTFELREGRAAALILSQQGAQLRGERLAR